jgi:ATP-dependent helicase HrpB
MMRPSLPVDDILPQLKEVLRTGNCVVLKAPAGSGKTTRVPPALMLATEESAAGESSKAVLSGKVLMLEPRRIAARTAARRIAAELQERPGKRVGYCVRFEQCLGPETRLLVVTEGILLRKLQDDPFLEDVDVVIFDEFHERRLDSDLALAMTYRIQQTVRPELKIVVMSATLDANIISSYLGGCPIISSEGRQYPVDIQYLRQAERTSLSQQVIRGLQQLLPHTSGDVLTFLPGVGEILTLQRELNSLAEEHQLTVMPLFGEMSAEEQDRVLNPSDRRKLILATNVAETSITIDGVTVVVDCGTARQMRFDSDTGLDRLELVPISKASADQRAGRAGRTAPGICLRLWDEVTHRARPEFDPPELFRVDLSHAVLRLAAWGEGDALSFPWFESPPESSIRQATRLLQLLEAIDERGITALGRRMEQLPVTPRLARLLTEGADLGIPERVSLMAAMLSERSAFQERRMSLPHRIGHASDGRQDHSGRGSASAASTGVTRTISGSRSDVVDRFLVLEQYLRSGQTESPFGTINHAVARTIERTARQFHRILADETAATGPAGNAAMMKRGAPGSSAEENAEVLLMQALLAAFPDRVARRRDVGSEKGLMVGGRGVRLAPSSAVVSPPLFLCVDVDGRGNDALVRQASAVERDWLPTSQLRTTDELYFHPSRTQVVARRRIWFADLLLEETPTAVSDSARAAEILFEAARGVLHERWLDHQEHLKTFLIRLRCLRQWMPELKLPEFSETELVEILRQLCEGARSFEDLDRKPWLTSVQSQLDYATRQVIDREAPEQIQVPSGSRMTLLYEEGRPPVLAVRIQDVFGWKQTPRIAGGRVPVLLHLLAPNRRPQQITDDLASFWAGAYGEVRKELKRRYPKHQWPEDPTTAIPGSRKP